jgi:hypothetical protein
MKQHTLEWMIGGAALAALSGGLLAAYTYKNHHRHYERDFNPDNLDEISGKIEEILYSGTENTPEQGLELLVHTGDELNSVHVGPVWYLDAQGKGFKPGDSVTVKGSRVILDHEPALVAQYIIRNGRKLTLRDEVGHPVWSAWTRVN